MSDRGTTSNFKMHSPTIKLLKNTFNLSKRDLGIFVPALQKAGDPIQQLFVDKIREFKSKSTGSGLVDPSPELQKELKNDRERILKQFGVKAGEDVTKFPTFKFTDPPFENPGLKGTD